MSKKFRSAEEKRSLLKKYNDLVASGVNHSDATARVGVSKSLIWNWSRGIGLNATGRQKKIQVGDLALSNTLRHYRVPRKKRRKALAPEAIAIPQSHTLSLTGTPEEIAGLITHLAKGLSNAS